MSELTRADLERMNGILWHDHNLSWASQSALIESGLEMKARLERVDALIATKAHLDQAAERGSD